MSANTELNVFGQSSSVQPVKAATSMMLSRQAQEVQAAMVIAKRFPRDERASADRILAACSRRSLAESAMYEYEKGGTSITGPSIRLAESIAQNWGNIDFGIIELEQRNGESQVMAYAWDLETNTRESKIFSVKHVRYTRNNGNRDLVDPRDIYETVASQGARRLRSCILGVIPGDVVDMAVKACEKTLSSSDKDPLEDRIKSMAEVFKNEFQVTTEMLSGYIGKRIEAFTETDLVRMKKVYRSLHDGIIGSEYFLDRMKDSANGTGNPAVQAENAEIIPGAEGIAGADIPSTEKKISLDDL